MSDIIEEKLSKIKTKEMIFQVNTIINKKKSKDIDKIKIYNKNLYVYLVENSIKVYNINTFKEIANLKLPFNRGEKSFLKEYITIEILENEIVLIMADKKLYFYKINLKENKLNFLHYFSEVHHFCYLEQKKEIFLLTENILIGDYYGMAKSDLFGKIIFRNKENQPKIYYEYRPPNEVSEYTLFYEMSSRTPIHFSHFDGFNNDKYIINIWGYTDNWYYYNGQGDKDEEYNISIYSSDNLKELFDKKYYVDLRYVKISDFYFKKCYGDLSIFYYNEKENTINYINDITNIIYKHFNLLCNEKVQEFNINDEEEEYIKYEKKYFYLKKDMFGIFDANFLFIVDLSSNNILKKIEMKKNNNEELYINCLNIINKNGKEYLYLSVISQNKINYDIKTKIIHGVIL